MGDMDEATMRQEMRERLVFARKAKADMLRAERKAIRASGGSTIDHLRDTWPLHVIQGRGFQRNGFNADGTLNIEPFTPDPK